MDASIALNQVLPVKEQPNRCVIVIDKDLSNGRAANAAAVIALTIGARHPALVGEALVDRSGYPHPGLIPIGISILAASQEELREVRRKGLWLECDVVDFPVEGQLTKNYRTFLDEVAALDPEGMSYVGVALIGQKKAIGKVVGDLALF